MSLPSSNVVVCPSRSDSFRITNGTPHSARAVSTHSIATPRPPAEDAVRARRPPAARGRRAGAHPSLIPGRAHDGAAIARDEWVAGRHKQVPGRPHSEVPRPCTLVRFVLDATPRCQQVGSDSGRPPASLAARRGALGLLRRSMTRVAARTRPAQIASCAMVDWKSSAERAAIELTISC